jgi:N-acetylmuramoyl-L-alanine amidase
MARVIINAGHGGSDPGGIYNNRLEKNDTLRLAFAVGEILSNNDIEVYYTRVSDTFISPIERARNANEVGGDLLVNLHRGFPSPTSESGARAFIDYEDRIAIETAENILEELEVIGFKNNGISIREGIYLLRNVNMPAFELVVGYIDSDYDNQLFDTRFDDIASAIAFGIMQTLDSISDDNL